MTPSILIVDDSAFHRRHLKEVLQRSDIGAEILMAGDGHEAIEALGRERVDLVLCDVMMPEMDGFELISVLGAELNQRQIAVIMLTADGAVESKVRFLEAGASDYLVKPFHGEELVARVKLHLQLKSLRDELRAKNEELVKLACFDSLTKIWNRRHFMDSFQCELDRAQRHSLPLCLCMIDVDHFKRINDAHGHQVGDLVLLRVAERLRAALRDHDLLGRYGGEEFACVFVNAGPEGARAAAERCRRLISAESFPTGGHELAITVSIGMALSSRPEDDSVEDLIRRADKALYAAKEQGRDRLVVSMQSDED